MQTTTTPSKPQLLTVWVGSKRRLLPQLRERRPADFGAYIDPFVGSGAAMFDIDPARHRLVVGDSNPDLIAMYQAVANDPAGVSDQLAAMAVRLDRAEYLEVRALEPASIREQAARAIYLAQTSFRGLWRVNQQGQFNVCWGERAKPNLPTPANVLAAHAHLRHASIALGDFEGPIDAAESGDLVYVDPPYVPRSATASFTSYTATGFRREDHMRLAAAIGRATRRGVYVMLSQSNTAAARELYPGLVFDVVELDHKVGGKTRSGRRVTEVIGVNYDSCRQITSHGAAQ